MLNMFQDCIIYLLAKAYQKAHGDFKKRLAVYNLTPIQHLILEALWHENGLSAKEIGDRLVLDPATLSGVLDRMSAGGWIIKQTKSEDKRILRICLTDKSNALKAELTYERDQSNADILHMLTVEEKVLLKRLLREISYSK
jgi:DNA-binding MarR family transcriptional regulator